MEPSRESFSRFFRWLVLIVVTAIIVVAGLSLVAHGADATAPAPAPLSWLTPEVITAAFGLIASIIALWQNRKKNTAEKIRDTLILGIEHGTTLAERTGNPKAIKQVVYERAKLAGVEEVLAPRVEKLTEFVGHEEHEKRVAIEASLPPHNSGADAP